VHISLALVLLLAQLVGGRVLGSADASAEPNIAVFGDTIMRHVSIWPFLNGLERAGHDGREEGGGSYFLFASFEALSPAPLAFELRYFAPCLDEGQLSTDTIRQGMKLLDGVHIGCRVV
jgi:hypothetical protein